VLALLLLCASAARADTIDRNATQLRSAESAKVRLAAALALSKSKDPRAVIAIADALGKDDDAAVRRVCALAFEKMIDSHTPADALALAFDSLDAAAARDADSQVRETADKVVKQLASFRKGARPAHSDKPEVFVKIDLATDQSTRAPGDAGDRLRNIVKKKIEAGGYATSWPGGTPTGSDLTTAGSRAFVVASTVKKIDISRIGSHTQIACTVSIRVAPWSGSDGGEKWEANKAASASGSAKAVTGSSPRDIQAGMRDCLDAVAEDLTARQIMPFLKRLVVAAN